MSKYKAYVIGRMHDALKFMLICICIDFPCKSPCSLDLVALISTSISNTDLTSNSAVTIMHQELHHDAAFVMLYICIYSMYADACRRSFIRSASVTIPCIRQTLD